MKSRFAGFEPIRRDRMVLDTRHHAHQGELEDHCNERENLLRVVWQR
jgi:hypothetical protein